MVDEAIYKNKLPLVSIHGSFFQSKLGYYTYNAIFSPSIDEIPAQNSKNFPSDLGNKSNSNKNNKTDTHAHARTHTLSLSHTHALYFLSV